MMDDDAVIIHVGTDPNFCPMTALLHISEALASMEEILEDINEGDHRHRYLSLAFTHLQEADNWLSRWFSENMDDDEESESSST